MRRSAQRPALHPDRLTRRAGAWQALLDPATRAARDAALADITAALAPLSAAHGPGPAGGSAGVALYFAQLAVAGDDAAADIAYAHLDAAVAALGSQATQPSLLAGFVGVAWVATVLQDMLEGSRDTSLTADIDEALVEHVARSPWRREYDLVSGLAGFGLYGLLRHGDDTGAAVIGHCVARLAELADRGGATTWFTPVEHLPQHQVERYPGGYHNLGLAHGVPAAIGFLAQAAATGSAGAEELCTAAVDWLLAQRLPAGAGGAFASVVELGAGETERHPARLAWCYGDPGVAAALLVAGTALHRDDWVGVAQGIARDAARRPAERSGVLDAGICHGAAGLALIFHRFHHASGDDEFAQAAAAWYRRLLDMRRPGTGVAGWQAWEPPNWIDDPGLLTGAAGIGLALLAAGGTVAPDWDRLLLLSPTVTR